MTYRDWACSVVRVAKFVFRIEFWAVCSGNVSAKVTEVLAKTEVDQDNRL